MHPGKKLIIADAIENVEFNMKKFDLIILKRIGGVISVDFSFWRNMWI